jgi:D-lyxose ketol-isomerase
MKRSLVNAAIAYAKELLEKNNFRLPDFGYWTLEEWKKHRDEIDVIEKLMLGWDLTDHGMNRFDEIGCTLFTIRNGLLHDPSVGVPYAEKLLIFKDGQRLPTHYHGYKTEDIINRAGGAMFIKLYNTKDGKAVDTPVEVYQDGIKHTYMPGEEIFIYPGNSITITPGIAHTFGIKPGCGDLICGEVSKVNDDKVDNFHIEIEPKQYADIEEDEAVIHPLCNEYRKLVLGETE